MVAESDFDLLKLEREAASRFVTDCFEAHLHLLLLDQTILPWPLLWCRFAKRERLVTGGIDSFAPAIAAL